MIDIISKLFKSFHSKEKKYFYILFILMFFGMLLEALSIGLVFPLLTFILDNNQTINMFKNIKFLDSINESFNIINFISLQSILIFLVVVFLFKNFFLLFQTYAQAKFSSFLGISKSQSLYNKYISLPYSFHINNNSGLLLRNITEEVGNYCGAVIVLMRLLTEIIVLIGIIFLLLFINTIITLIVITVFVLILFIYQNITKKFFLKWGKQKQIFFGERIIIIQQTFGAFKELKILNRFKKFYDYFRLKNESLYKINIKNETLISVPKFLIESILIIIICIILIYFSLVAELSSSIPLLGVMAVASFRIMPSVNRIINYIQELRYFNASLGLVTQEFVKWNDTEKIDNKVFEKITFNTQINFKDVIFSYEKDEILSNISISIKFGDIIGIFGNSGSGKSTFLDLLIGLHKPLSGNILADNTDIHSNILGWYSNIGYVPQNVYLIDDTIKSNIALGIYEKDIDDVNLNNAIKFSGLKEFIETLDNGVNTIVGENGVSLSGGQKQRIGIARALYNNPQILILDEATSSLDETNEKNILEYIFNLRNKITIIIVSHNKKNLYDCNKIYRVENKKLILTSIK